MPTHMLYQSIKVLSFKNTKKYSWVLQHINIFISNILNTVYNLWRAKLLPGWA